MATNALPQQEATVIIKLRIPESLYDKYAEQAISSGKISAEAEIGERIKRCQDYTSGRALYFGDKQLSALEKALGHLCQNPDVVLEQLKHAVTLTVGSIDVPLSERLQQRLRSRVFRGDTYEKMIKREVVVGLERHAGIRPA